MGQAGGGAQIPRATGRALNIPIRIAGFPPQLRIQD
jgi:hypothetical protein